MGKTVELDAAGLAVARREFHRFYLDHPPAPPPRFARREFAAFPFAAGTFMRRHAAFRTAEEFHGYFQSADPPRHVYYSSAYYRHPAHPRMTEKEWLGADLIFDLDADHLRGAEMLDFPGQLARVKERFRHLLDEFLFGDFGIDPEATTLAFSGGRGYHVHVHEAGYLALTSVERRELVDYILGTEVDPKAALRSESGSAGGLVAGGGERRRGRGAPTRFLRLADPADGGWAGRISRSFLDQITRWEAAGLDVAAREIEGWGIPRPKARKIARRLLDASMKSSLRTKLSLEVFEGTIPEEFLRAALDRARIEVQGETDAPVTTDIHRLIRLPGSRHGGTGLVVTPISRDQLDAFDPLRDAVAPDRGVEPIRITPTVTVRYPFAGAAIDIREGESVALAPSAALFLLLRGEANVTPAPV